MIEVDILLEVVGTPFDEGGNGGGGD